MHLFIFLLSLAQYNPNPLWHIKCVKFWHAAIYCCSLDGYGSHTTMKISMSLIRGKIYFRSNFYRIRDTKVGNSNRNLIILIKFQWLYLHITWNSQPKKLTRPGFHSRVPNFLFSLLYELLTSFLFLSQQSIMKMCKTNP